MAVKENFASRFRQLDTGELSKTVVKAIQTTKRMGLRYVWIDAICLYVDQHRTKYHRNLRFGPLFSGGLRFAEHAT
jgi:hypothetical protein